jgi:type IV secretory pathway VirB10-like protein
MRGRQAIVGLSALGLVSAIAACGEKPAPAPAPEPTAVKAPTEPAPAAELPDPAVVPELVAAAPEPPAPGDSTAPTWGNDDYIEVRLEPARERPTDDPAATGPRVGLSWPAAKDDVAVVRYEVTSNGRLLTTVEAPATQVTVAVPPPSSDDDEIPTSRVTFTVEAVDAAGNRAACPVNGGYTWSSVADFKGLTGGGEGARPGLGAGLGGDPGAGRLGGKAGLLAPGGLREPGAAPTEGDDEEE